MFNPRAAFADLIAKKPIELPPYPAIAMRLNKLLSDDDYTLVDVAELISLDPALAVRCLRLASSAVLGPSATQEVSLTTALGRLGANRISRVALAAALSPGACGQGPLSALRYLAWRKSLLTAFLAQHLANKSDAEDAFLCGLLLGLGRTITLAYLERAAREKSAVALLPAATWLSVVGEQERQIGARVARGWELPETVCAVIANQSSPGRVEVLLDIVGQADAVVEALETRAALGGADLQRLGVPTSKQNGVLDFLPQLPGLVDALNDPDGDLPKQLPQLVQPPSEMLSGPLFEVDFPVAMTSGKRQFNYRATQLGPSGCIAQGSQRIPENWFARMTLKIGEQPFEMWSKVTACSECQGEVQIAFQPYALSAGPEARWLELVALLEQSAA